jgi:hypothetical protein
MMSRMLGLVVVVWAAEAVEISRRLSMARSIDAENLIMCIGHLKV